MADQGTARPTWIVGACIGIGVAFGVIFSNNLAIEPSLLRIVVAAVIGGVSALFALLIAQRVVRPRSIRRPK